MEDPVLDVEDIPEALRDINGEISRSDSAVILEVELLDYGTSYELRVERIRTH